MTDVPNPSNPTGEVQATPHLLVLDDEHAVRKLLVRMLSREGYTIHETSNIRDAHAMAASIDRLDVFVTDANVDGCDATLEIVKIRERHPRLAVVLVSGCEPEHDRAEELAKLGVKFLAKPFSQAELRSAIDFALRHGSATSAVVPLASQREAAEKQAR